MERDAAKAPIHAQHRNDNGRVDTVAGTDGSHHVAAVHQDLAQRDRSGCTENVETPPCSRLETIRELTDGVFAEFGCDSGQSPVGFRTLRNDVADHCPLLRLREVDQVAKNVTHPPAVAPRGRVGCGWLETRCPLSDLKPPSGYFGPYVHARHRIPLSQASGNDAVWSAGPRRRDAPARDCCAVRYSHAYVDRARWPFSPRRRSGAVLCGGPPKRYRSGGEGGPGFCSRSLPDQALPEPTCIGGRMSDVTHGPAVVRPSKASCRLPLVLATRDDRSRYFVAGGFRIDDGIVTLIGRQKGERASLQTSDVSAVCLAVTRVRPMDYRVLLVDRAGRVLAQDSGLFYSDDDLARVSEAIGCPMQNEEFRTLADLLGTHPGVFRHAWEAKPVKAALVGVLAFLVVLALIVSLVTVLG